MFTANGKHDFLLQDLLKFSIHLFLTILYVNKQLGSFTFIFIHKKLF